MSPTPTTATISELRRLFPPRRTDEQVLQEAVRWMRFCDHVAVSSLARAIGVSATRLRRLVEESSELRLRDGASLRRHLGLTWSRGLANPHTGNDTHLVRDEYTYVEHIHR
jgi:hypothetical protein